MFDCELTGSELLAAEERGRRLAVLKMRENPGKRKEVEDAFGIDYCKNRYPEVYARDGISISLSSFAKLLKW